MRVRAERRARPLRRKAGRLRRATAESNADVSRPGQSARQAHGCAYWRVRAADWQSCRRRSAEQVLPFPAASAAMGALRRRWNPRKDEPRPEIREAWDHAKDRAARLWRLIPPVLASEMIQAAAWPQHFRSRCRGRFFVS